MTTPGQFDERRDHAKVQPIELHPGADQLTRKVAEFKTTKSKGQRIVEECLETGEPFFVLRAKDILSLFPIQEYLRVVELYGPSDHQMQEGVAHWLEEFKRWQRENVTQVRYPD